MPMLPAGAATLGEMQLYATLERIAVSARLDGPVDAGRTLGLPDRKRGFCEARNVRFVLVADWQPHEYVVPLADPG